MPFSEEAHRRLITRLAAAGDRAASVQAYRTLTERLRTELGVAPSQLTRELIEQVTVEPLQPIRAATGAVPAGLPALLGREPELRALDAAWTAAAAGTGGAALIRGEAGIGKTRLSTELRARVMRTGALCAGVSRSRPRRERTTQPVGRVDRRAAPVAAGSRRGRELAR